MESTGEKDVRPIPRGWAADPGELRDKRAVADRLKGGVVANVRYVTLDYGRSAAARADDPGGLDWRLITSNTEWEDPSWLVGVNHTIDFAIELAMSDGRVFYVRWDPLGDAESMCLGEGYIADELYLLGGAAIWDVSTEEPWVRFVGSAIESVSLGYEAWSNDGGFWCTSILISAGDSEARIELKDVDADGKIIPAVNNLMVLIDTATEVAGL